LRNLDKTSVTVDWLSEFWGVVDVNDSSELLRAYPNARKDGDWFAHQYAWDMVPAY